MSNFFCECKDSGEPPCFGLVQLRTDLAARDAELAALTLQFSEMRRRWQLRDLYATQQEERAEAAERQNDDHAAYIAGIERDRDEWKRKAEENARAIDLARRAMAGEGVEDQGQAWDKCLRILDAAIAAKGEA